MLKMQSRTYQYPHSGNGQIAHINGMMTEYVVLNTVVDKIRDRTKVENPVLQSVTVRCTNRSATFFIDPDLAGIVSIYYLNCFEVPEHILCIMPRTTTEKVKSDRSVALLGKISEFYDNTHSKEYEVESGPLIADECL